MRAYEHLAAHGRLDDDGAKLLYRCVRAVARVHNFPPPCGQTTWTTEAVVEAAHDFLTEERGPARMVEITASASDDESLARLLQASVRNYLADVGRRTEVGRVVVRLKELVRCKGEFVSLAGGRVGLAGWLDADGGLTVSSAWGGRPEGLVSAAWRVPNVRLLRWRGDVARRSPLAEEPSLVALCGGVLSEASAALTFGELAEAIASRLGLEQGPLVVPLDTAAPFTDIASGAADAALSSAAHQAAVDLLDQLGEQERIVLEYLDATVSEAAQASGMSRSAAGRAIIRAKAKIALILSDDPDGAAVLRAAAELLALRRERIAGTDPRGPT